MSLDTELRDDAKYLTKLMSGLFVLSSVACFSSDYLGVGFSDDLKSVMYCLSGCGFLTSLIMYKKLKSSYENRVI